MSLPKTMKALRVYAPHDQKIDEVPIPKIGEGEVLIKVLGCGVCAGDIKTYHGGLRVWGKSPGKAYIEVPCIGGHEFYGEAVEIGAGIDGVKLGDKLLAEQILPCGECKFCKVGIPWMCLPHRIYGFKKDAQGGFAEYMKFAKGSLLHKLPHDFTVEQGAIVEPYACAMHAVERAEIKHPDVVVVSGLGAIGLGMINAIKKDSPRLIIGLDLKQRRLNKAKEFGADIVLNPKEINVVEEVKKLTDGYGCDVYIEASGNEISVRQGLDMIINQGRFVLFGVFPEEIMADWNIIGDTKEMDIRGAHLSGHCYEPVIKGMADGTIRTDGVVTHTFKIDEWEKAFDTAENNPDAIKVVLVP
jgi:L-iditol 2-dehydrogenase